MSVSVDVPAVDVPLNRFALLLLDDDVNSNHPAESLVLGLRCSIRIGSDRYGMRWRLRSPRALECSEQQPTSAAAAVAATARKSARTFTLDRSFRSDETGRRVKLQGAAGGEAMVPFGCPLEQPTRHPVPEWQDGVLRRAKKLRGTRISGVTLRPLPQRVPRKSPWHERAVPGENRSAGPAPCADPYRARNVYSLFPVHMRAPQKAVALQRHHVETHYGLPGRQQRRSAHTKDFPEPIADDPDNSAVTVRRG